MTKNETMLFHEVYGTYYQAVAKILSQAVQGNLTRKDISKIVQQYLCGKLEQSDRVPFQWGLAFSE